MKIAVIGTGYVGLVTAVSLASFGHNVSCIGRNKDKIGQINQGKAPFYEPNLQSLLRSVLLRKRIYATADFHKSVAQSDISILAVGTPTIGGRIDLSEVKEASEQLGRALRHRKAYQVIVVKSTVIPMTTEEVVKPILEKSSSKKIGKELGLCMSPEFLREGNALEDALYPDRIIIGQYDVRSGETFSQLYKKLNIPFVFTNLQTAEMIKYAVNGLFATLISYSNEIARISEAVDGVDVVDVWRGVHLDRRISAGTSHYIYSGAGFGGSCLPKDTKALLGFAKKLGIETNLLKSVIDINTAQPQRLVTMLKNTIGNLKGKKIAILGLTFKPNTDDLRESASLAVVDALIKNEARVFCHDPMIPQKRQTPELVDLPITLTTNLEDALKDADGALVLTAWNEYKKLTPAFFKTHMKNPVLIDGRRIYSKAYFIDSGVAYKGIGLSTP